MYQALPVRSYFFRSLFKQRTPLIRWCIYIGPDPSAAAIPEGAIVTRVRALHPFTPTEAGELGFEKGDVIKVVDRGYRDWWRGQLRGRTGIFPVNYVVSG